MPRKILASERAKFWRFRNAGYSIKEAADKAGFSESYGKMLVRSGMAAPDEVGVLANRGSVAQATADDMEVLFRPKRYEDLCDEAKRAFHDFEYFRYRYLGSISVPWQVEAGHEVLSHLESDDDSYGVINCPQGGGKTRLFSHDVPAWLTARDRTIRGCLGSLGLNVSESMTRNLRTTLERKSPAVASPRWKLRGMAADAEVAMYQDFGRFKPVMAGVEWTHKKFSVEQYWDGDTYIGGTQDKESTWAAFSYEAQVMSNRFDFMEWDDVHTGRMMRNQDSMDEFYSWWDEEAESRLDPGGLCLVTMQRLGANDISRYLLDKLAIDFEIDADRPDDAEPPRQYFHIVYKAHYDELCEGRHSIDMAPWPETCMLDPKRITPQKIAAKRESGTYEVVYQQQDTDPKSVLVNQVWVEGGEFDGVTYPGCWDDHRPLGFLPERLPPSRQVRYMTVDPSPTKWWSIMDWLYVLPADTERLAGDRHLIDFRRDKMGANQFLDWSNDQQAFVGLAEEWVQRSKVQGFPITHLIMEKNAAQRWAMQYDFFTRWCRSRGVQVIQHETGNNKNDPQYGVWATLPNVYRNARVRLPGDRATGSRQAVWPLVYEVTNYPNSTTDDCVMSQWFGEVNLQHLVSATDPVGTIYTDIPSWVQGGAPNARVQHIREVTGAVR